MRSLWLYRLLVVVGLAVAVGSLAWLRVQAAQVARAAARPAEVSVLAPRVTLPAGSVLAMADLETLALPAGAAPPGSLAAGADLNGAVARQTLWAGEPLVAGMLYPNVTQAQVDYRLPPGMRAVDLPVGEAGGVGGLLVVGDRVDVVWVDSATPARAEILLSDVPVLALVGGGGGGATAAAAQTAGGYSSAVLEVTPRQAAALALAQAAGSVSLALRNPLDSGAPAPTLTVAALTGGVR
jgi:pilus assembly protein CpaB